MLRRKHYIPK
ncbi:hypothetical protein CP061683_0316A, partial [Chlamydia psittaci 06-1683]